MNVAKEMQTKGANVSSRVALGAALCVAVLGVCGVLCAGEHNKNMSTKNSESVVTTNENGSISRRYTESVVTTNGNMITEHRRETNTTMDADGNVLVCSTSEYNQSYATTAAARPGTCPKMSCKGPAPEGAYPPPNCFKKGVFPPPPPPPTGLNAAKDTDSFMGLKFNSEFTANTNFVVDAAEPALLRTTFTPKKPLADFDDYYVYVTPTTHKVARVVACARAAVDSGIRWKRHYLIEALERRYDTWARLSSFSRPCYDFNIGQGRGVRVCLADATPDYQTVIEAWDEAALRTAAEEYEASLQKSRRAAAEERGRRVNDATEAF
jgi:hypothetical protein